VNNIKLEEQFEISETNFRREKGEMIEEMNRLSTEREEIEALARENVIEIEQKF